MGSSAKLTGWEKKRGSIVRSIEQLGLPCQPGISKAQIPPATGRGRWHGFISKTAADGAAGCGKSYLACVLGRHFIRQGVAVRYYRLKTLLEER